MEQAHSYTFALIKNADSVNIQIGKAHHPNPTAHLPLSHAKRNSIGETGLCL